MNILKWIGLGIGSALAIVLVGIVYITVLLDPNDYIDDITDKVKTESNIDLGIGSVSWSFFPWLGMMVEAISVAHPDSGELARVEQVRLRLQILPLLLQRKIEVGNLRVVQGEIAAINSRPAPADTDNPKPLSDPLRFDLEANLQADWEAGTAAVQVLTMSVDDMHLTGAVNLTQLTKDPAIQGQITVAAFNPKPLLKKLAIELPPMTSPTALDRLQLSSQLSGSYAQFTASNLKIVIDNTTLTGEVKFSNPAQPTLTGKIAADTIDLDNYVPLSSDSPSMADTTAAVRVDNAQVAAGGQATVGATTPLIPVDAIKPLNLKANLSIDEAIVHRVPIKDIAIQITADRGIVHLSRFSGDTLEGKVQLEATLDVNPPAPTIIINHRLNSLQLAPLVKAFTDSNMFAGAIDAKGIMRTQGNTSDAIIAHLTGLNEIAISDGVIKGVNVTQFAVDKLGNLGPLIGNLIGEDNKQTIPTILRKDTTVDNLFALVELDNGVARTRQLSADLEQAKADGHIEMNLLEQRLAMLLNLKLNDTIANPYVAKLRWPIRCQGSLAAAPHCAVDTGDVRRQLEKLAKAAAEKKARAALERKLSDKLGIDLSGDTADRATRAKAAAADKLAAEKARLQEQVKERKEEAKHRIEEKLNNKIQDFFR